jgi:hypothetical protein
MGLLEKASAFARARSLLHRSLELLSEDTAAPSAPAPRAARAAPAGPAEPPVFDVPVFRIRVENTGSAEEPASPPAPSRTAPSAPPPADPSSFAKALAGAVASLEPTIDLPSRLFGLLKDRFGITKGALLLHDAERQVFAPWAATGYDQATLRRMRIPPDDAAVMQVAEGRSTAIGEGGALPNFRRYFSSREAGSLPDFITLSGFGDRGHLLGLLVITEASPGPWRPTSTPFHATMSEAAAAAVPALHRLRDEILRAGRPGPVSPKEAREDLTRFLAAHVRDTQPFTVFTLSLERCRKRVISENPWYDHFRLEEDLRGVVAAFTADLGRAVHLGRLRFLVAVRDLSPADVDLFAHQLASMLGSLFHAAGFEPADAEIGTAHTFPDGTEATPEAAAGLLASLAAS